MYKFCRTTTPAAVAAFMDDVPHEQFTEDAEDESVEK